VTFKLDPRLTRGAFLGDRWVSPPTYTAVGQGMRLDVQVRAYAGEAGGQAVSAGWIASDSGMVALAPQTGHEVTISVRRPGVSRIQVVSGELSATISISAVSRNDILQADFSQR